MRSALAISISVHVLISLIAFNWVSFREVKYIPRQVYNVTLVPEPAAATPEAVREVPPNQEEPKAEPEPPPEPEEEMVTPTPRPKPKPKPKKPKPREVPKTDIEPPKPDESAESEEAAEASPETGDVSLDTDDFPFAPYINRVRRKIAANWRVPEGSQGEERLCRVYFRIERSGGVSAVAVEESSGLFMFDQAAERAVLQSAPMPPLPRQYRDRYLGVHFSFVYRERR